MLFLLGVTMVGRDLFFLYKIEPEPAIVDLVKRKTDLNFNE